MWKPFRKPTPPVEIDWNQKLEAMVKANRESFSAVDFTKRRAAAKMALARRKSL